MFDRPNVYYKSQKFNFNSDLAIGITLDVYIL